MKTILFYPDNLRKTSRLWPAIDDLNIPYHNNKNVSYDIPIFWSYTPDKIVLDSFVKNNFFLNKGCYDITKTRIDKYFDDLVIDPEKYEGLVVRKTELQCDRKEVLLQAPTKKEKGYVYRKYIDTKINDSYYDYRLFYFGKPSFLIQIENKTSNPFYKGEERIWKVIPLETIPQNTLNIIEANSKNFGLDIGEIDLLKDKNGDWHVIDINNVAGRVRPFEECTGAFIKYKQQLWEFINDYSM